MSSPTDEDASILPEHEAIYARGQRLLLSPHKPLPPYGSHLYPLPLAHGVSSDEMMLSEEEKNFSLRRLVFDPRNSPKTLEHGPHDKRAEMEVEIVDMIGGRPGSGYSPGPQKLICRVVVAPSTSPTASQQEMPVKGQLLFLKIFDALFWHKLVDYTKRSIKTTIQADSAFADEYGAYHHLYDCGLTGFFPDVDPGCYPDVAPEFFGGWTLEAGSVISSFAGQSRRIAVLALEYIDGVRLSDLFSREGPSAETVELYKNDPPLASFNTDLDTRMKLMAQLMDGSITQERFGLDHTEVRAWNVIISMRHMGKALETPRAVLVGYGRALVDHLRTEPAEFWVHFKKKHHPIIRFGWVRLESFEGWVPSEWRGSNSRRALLLKQWMVRTFGGLDVNEHYTIFATETFPPPGEELQQQP